MKIMKNRSSETNWNHEIFKNFIKKISMSILYFLFDKIKNMNCSSTTTMHCGPRTNELTNCILESTNLKVFKFQGFIYLLLNFIYFLLFFIKIFSSRYLVLLVDTDVDINFLIILNGSPFVLLFSLIVFGNLC